MVTCLLALALVFAGTAAGTAEAPSVLAALEKETADLTARALPSVVRVAGAAGRAALRLETRGYDGRRPEVRAARLPTAATGFVWDAEGTIVTADTREKGNVRVTLHDGREVEAKVVGTDPMTGLSVLKAPPAGLAPLPMGDSAAVRPGAWVIGLVAAPGAATRPYLGTVAATDQVPEGVLGPAFALTGLPAVGGAGAPVLNARGQVIAVLLSGPGGLLQAPAPAHAIPVHVAMPIIEQLKAGQPVRRGFLGLKAQELTPELAQLVGLEAGAGVFVQDVTAGGPAAAGGVEAEDVVVAVDGKPVRSPQDLVAAAAALAPGKEARLTLWRKGQKLELKVVAGERPNPPRAARLDAPGLEILPELQRVLPNLQFGVPGDGKAAPGLRQFIEVLPGAGGGKKPADLLVSVDFQAGGLLEAAALGLNGTGQSFTIAADLVKDQALRKKPFGLKATNTPLSQVLDQLCAAYGIGWSWEGGPVLFERK